jgi:hypothetical protein
MNNANIFYINYQGNLANTPLNNGTPTARLTSNNTFSFKKGWTSELNLSYATKQEVVIWL